MHKAQLHPDFDQHLGGYTSDHTRQSIEVIISNQNQPDLTLRGSTLNELGQCYDKAHCKDQTPPYSNNPFDTQIA